MTQIEALLHHFRYSLCIY